MANSWKIKCTYGRTKYNTTIGGAGAEEDSSSVAGGSGDGQCKGGTGQTSRGGQTDPLIEPKQISSEGAAASKVALGLISLLTVQRLVTPMRGQLVPQSKKINNGLP